MSAFSYFPGGFTSFSFLRSNSWWISVVTILTTLIATVLASTHHSPHIVVCSSLVVFGDGLSDDGAEVSGEDSHGFLRNSNGPVWCEYLRQLLGCEKYVNYAYSGARSGYSNFYFDKWSGVRWQVEQFAARRALRPDKHALVILQTGGLIDLFSGETNATAIVKNLRSSLKTLTDSSNLAQSTVVLLNLPDLSSAPGLHFAEDGALIKDNFSVSIAQINTQIRSLALEFSRRRDPSGSRVDVRLFDLNSAMFRAISPLNSTEPFSYQRPELRPLDISHYAYHDLWHPTTVVHFEIAKELVTFLEDA